MRKIGSFKWENGSVNDGVRKILILNGIKYFNNFNGDIIADGKKIIIEKSGTFSTGLTVTVFL